MPSIPPFIEASIQASYPLMPTSAAQFPSSLALPGFESGFQDILALVPQSETSEPSVWGQYPSLSTLSAGSLLPVNRFSFRPEQEPLSQERLAGGGYDPTTFDIGQIKVRADADMPLLIAQNGWVDPSFARLWHYARQGVQGTTTATIGRISGTDALSGSTILLVSNIDSFLSLPLPILAEVYANPTRPLAPTKLASGLVITAADRISRTITLSSATAQTFPVNSLVVVRPEIQESAPSPVAFTLLSAREGMLRPCLVSSLTIEAKADGLVSIKCEFASCAVARSHIQSAIVNAVPGLVSQLSVTSYMRRVIESNTVQVRPFTARSGAFGLSGAIGDPLFGGFQGLGLPNLTITGITLTIDNGLEEIYGAWSAATDRRIRQRENSFPIALASSKGRTVKGTITYREPISAWQVAERLSGPSALAAMQGLYFSFGVFGIGLPEIAWSPASSEGTAEEAIERTLQWTMAGETGDALPALDRGDLSLPN